MSHTYEEREQSGSMVDGVDVELDETSAIKEDVAPVLNSWAGPALSPSGRPTATLTDQSDIEVTRGPPQPQPRFVELPDRRASVRANMETLRAWGLSAYKCSRQMVAERLGTTTRTYDTELDAQVSLLRETQAQYWQLMRVAKSLFNDLSSMRSSQLQLGELFKQLGQRAPELRCEFDGNAESQRSLHETAGPLSGALAAFAEALETLCDQTIEDTLATVRQYELARVEYDAYRADLEWAQGQTVVAPATIADAQRQHDMRKADYLRLKERLAVKLRLLDENRVHVLRSQLVAFHEAVTAYFSGNTLALQKTLQHLRTSPSTSSQSASATPSPSTRMMAAGDAA